MRCNLCVVFTATVFTIFLAASFLARSAVADPLPGRDVLKFSQQPMIATPISVQPGAVELFNGHDEISTAWGSPSATGITTYSGPFMADDFADTFSSPVVHVKWWGSYLNRPTAVPDPTVRRFLISFESDVPATTAGSPFSRPGEPLLNQIVRFDADGVLTEGEGMFTEREIPGVVSVDGPIFEYNAELYLDKPFRQEPNKVYWLKIVALVDADPNIPVDQRLQWGWHNRDYTKTNPLASPAVAPGEFIDGFLPTAGGDVPIWHFQDDAVSGVVGVLVNPDMPIMPTVVQTGYQPENYQAPSDGPSLIATHSKDLAFELYTIPEPASAALALVALAGWGWSGRRRRN